MSRAINEARWHPLTQAVLLPRLRAVVASQPATARLATELADLETGGQSCRSRSSWQRAGRSGAGWARAPTSAWGEARRKGAGLPWADANVHPRLALRTAVWNDRWDACWSVSAREQRREVAVGRQARRAQ